MRRWLGGGRSARTTASKPLFVTEPPDPGPPDGWSRDLDAAFQAVDARLAERRPGWDEASALEPQPLEGEPGRAAREPAEPPRLDLPRPEWRRPDPLRPDPRRAEASPEPAWPDTVRADPPRPNATPGDPARGDVPLAASVKMFAPAASLAAAAPTPAGSPTSAPARLQTSEKALDAMVRRIADQLLTGPLQGEMHRALAEAVEKLAPRLPVPDSPAPDPRAPDPPPPADTPLVTIRIRRRRPTRHDARDRMRRHHRVTF
ncbi:MAG: hypothetical protein AB1635_21655 [Acidobacteriota bacterium]